VLPLSIYGAVAMAHGQTADDGYAAADEFFIYKFDRGSSGLAGLSFDEGTFGVFGYVTKVGLVVCKSTRSYHRQCSCLITTYCPKLLAAVSTTLHSRCITL
jgi:hypothetical protein